MSLLHRKNPFCILVGLLREPKMVHWRLRWLMLRRIMGLPMFRGVAARTLITDSFRLFKDSESEFRSIISIWEGVYIDVGAYIGDTVLLARKAKTIIAIEPVPSHVKILQALSGEDDRITVIPHAAGDGSPQEFLQIDDGVNSMFAESLMFKKLAHNKKITNRMFIKTVRIDDLQIPDGNLLIKIDAEGGETKVLRGAEKTIVERNPVLLIECHGTYDQVADFLAKHGYRFTRFPSFKSKEHYYLVATKKSISH